ncbi:MAG: prepilin-type N-terminal cleavage/methylation domain-containing protein [Alphaproteobacteria bacterium]|nr:prepilin-type N-terminal cleavage/methylation domain-containing protein [Alphaproteobacteria bacterium]MCB9692116.1 prepilin-type N-terminal cleavage/methylation domain-containing protein [Alphaproteobacteria bacterium]
MSHFLPSLTRRGFSLLEVMIALAILTTSIVILVETQSTAAWATREAEKVVTGTDLARYKMSEALLRVEADGFTDGEIFESGDFRDLGDEVLNLQMGEALEDFHWEYAVQEIDIQLAGDIAAMASEFAGDDGGGEGGPAIPGLPGGAGGLSALLSPEMLSQMLGPYIREVRVRVWWGKNSDEAEDYGSEVILVSHVINPSGDLVNLGGGLGL